MNIRAQTDKLSCLRVSVLCVSDQTRCCTPQTRQIIAILVYFSSFIAITALEIDINDTKCLVFVRARGMCTGAYADDA